MPGARHLPLAVMTRMAWRNLWRNHRRTFIMLLAIAVGVWAMIFMTALMRGMVDQMVEDGIDSLPGFVQIHHPEYHDDPSIGNSLPQPGPELLEALHENPLPASFELSLSPEGQSANRVNALTTMADGYPGVDEVVAQIAWVQRLDRIAQGFSMVTLVIGLIVLVSSIFVISNTVRLTVEERADQIEIMKLVGATNAFIRMPFVLTGGLQGFMAGLIAMVVLVFAHRVVSSHLPELWFFGQGQLIGFALLSGSLGAFGSAIALRRHLKL